MEDSIKIFCISLLIILTSGKAKIAFCSTPVKKDVVLTNCSKTFIDLEDKLNFASSLSLRSKVNEAIRIYNSFDSILDDAQLPIREKVILANRVSQGYIDNFKYRLGLDFAKKYLNIAIPKLDAFDFELGKAYEALGVFQSKAGDLDGSMNNLTQALSILKFYSGQHSIYFHLGMNYLHAQNFIESTNAFNVSIANINVEDLSILNLRTQFKIQFQFIDALILSGDFGKAEQTLKKVQYLANMINEPFYNFLVNYKSAAYYLNTGNRKKARTYLDIGVPDHPHTSVFKAGFYFYKGIIELGYKNYNTSAEFFQESINTSLSNGEEFFKFGNNYLWMGRAYTYAQEYDKALKAFDDGLCLFENTGAKFNSIRADLKNVKGELYLEQGKLIKAKHCFLSALSLDGDRTEGKMTNVLDVALVHLEHFKNNQNEAEVDSIIFYMDLNDKLLDQMRSEHRYFEDQGAVEYIANEIYSENLEILEYLYDYRIKTELIDKIFKYMEGIKSYSFKQELKEQEGLHTYGVPKLLIENLNSVKSEVKHLQEEIYENGKDSTSLMDQDKYQIAYNEKLLKLELLKTQYNTILQNIETEYPSYFNFKYNHTALTISDIQDVLSPNEALVEYFIDDHAIFIIAIKQDTIHYFNKEKPVDWDVTITEYLNSAGDSDYQHQDSTAVTFSKFSNSAHKIFNMVLVDVINELEDDVKYLTIIPDEKLHFIQFDNLLTEPANPNEVYRDLSYLINDFTISRAPSAYMFSTLKKRKRTHYEYKYVGFAPKYKSENIAIVDSLESDRRDRLEYYNDLVTRGTLVDLPSARESVRFIASLLGGISFVGPQATREMFLERSSEGNILHFAGHAINDDQNPKYSQLLFSQTDADFELYASDIYDIGLDLDLAVLSACNTGNGKLKRFGDGVLSLSRAFKYAGCSSVVMSLWSIPDIQTAQLDNSFFENIKRGERIDDALRDSKLAFLKSATFKTSHPFYWSGMTASGKMEPIQKTSLWTKFINLLN